MTKTAVAEHDSSPQRNVVKGIAGFVSDGFTLDQKELTEAGRVDLRIDHRTTPNAPRLNAPVIGRRDRYEVGR